MCKGGVACGVVFGKRVCKFIPLVPTVEVDMVIVNTIHQLPVALVDLEDLVMDSKDFLVLEDWEGLVNILKLVKNKFKSAEEEMKKRSNKQLAHQSASLQQAEDVM